MMWPFAQKEEKPKVLVEVSHETLCRILGRPIKLGGVNPTTLKEKLKTNRAAQKSGHGEPYWNSVVRIVEDHYGIAADAV